MVHALPAVQHVPQGLVNPRAGRRWARRYLQPQVSFSLGPRSYGGSRPRALAHSSQSHISHTRLHDHVALWTCEFWSAIRLLIVLYLHQVSRSFTTYPFICICLAQLRAPSYGGMYEYMPLGALSQMFYRESTSLFEGTARGHSNAHKGALRATMRRVGDSHGTD